MALMKAGMTAEYGLPGSCLGPKTLKYRRHAVGSPNARRYASHRCSQHALWAAYGLLGVRGRSSVAGVAPPYTELLEAITSFLTPARLAASSRFWVPATFASKVSCGLPMLRGTDGMAAWCRTNSADPTAASQSAGFRSVPSTISNDPTGRWERFSILPEDRLSSTRTRCPSDTSRVTRCDPMKPAPPVTSMVAMWDYTLGVPPLKGLQCRLVHGAVRGQYPVAR